MILWSNLVHMMTYRHPVEGRSWGESHRKLLVTQSRDSMKIQHSQLRLVGQ